MSEDFAFNMKAKKVRKTDGQLLESLHQFSAQNEMEYFSTVKYNGWEKNWLALK
jgi:hypothetical protein